MIIPASYIAIWISIKYAFVRWLTDWLMFHQSLSNATEINLNYFHWNSINNKWVTQELHENVFGLSCVRIERVIVELVIAFLWKKEKDACFVSKILCFDDANEINTLNMDVLFNFHLCDILANNTFSTLFDCVELLFHTNTKTTRLKRVCVYVSSHPLYIRTFIWKKNS